ncbi:MAG: 50S ribosomal protein L35 [bacterium]
MPKMKSHSGVKQRFKRTGTGKIVRRQQNRGHKLVNKSASRKRRLAKTVRLSNEDSKMARKLLGISINNKPD